MARQGEKVPELPAELKYEFWDKGKAKLTPSTGLGAELKKIEPAYKAIKIHTINSLSTAGGPKDVAAGVKEIEKLWPKIEDLRKVLKKFETEAKKQSAAAKKNKLFPKKSRELIDRMAAAADLYQLTVRDTPDRMKREAEAFLADYDTRKKAKYDLVIGTHDKLMQHETDAAEADIAVTQACKAALLAAKGGDAESAKGNVERARTAMGTLGRLVQACEADSKVWRTDKSGDLDADDKKPLIAHANGIMTINKAVMTRKKKAEAAVQQTEAAVAKLTGG